MLTLGIDTSGKIASVALADESGVLAHTTIVTKLTHSQVILPLVKKLLADACINLEDIEAIAVANGPGSYTGLRIGIAAVKGICFASGVNCAGISTLESLAYNVCCADAVVFSVMKARNDIAYFGIYKADGSSIKCLESDTVCKIDDILKATERYSGKIILVGDYACEIKEKLFADNDSICIAPPKDRLQMASSLCYAVIDNPKRLGSADKLDAAYLQETKAEKDKLHSEKEN